MVDAGILASAAAATLKAIPRRRALHDRREFRFMDWQVVLRSWCQPRVSLERLRRRGIVPVSELVANALGVGPERVEPCLQVLDGRPSRYGVVVDAGSSYGRRQTSQ